MVKTNVALREQISQKIGSKRVNKICPVISDCHESCKSCNGESEFHCQTCKQGFMWRDGQCSRSFTRSALSFQIVTRVVGAVLASQSFTARRVNQDCCGGTEVC